ncbi:type II secretion system F family protein [Spongiactinospora sp. TRM90649]|uniref:type II secretion system F family protein n=1 Tax=Spongiactinospora sp. TRM90649 TaxID=3031114 RepID=UPI0023F9829C|nr:type II secretion system F family protein [Spongiactinospora sp. TRM90649]MDF5751267.1 type II secretion system protein [Spongiactinospora sp. TRM90649]
MIPSWSGALDPLVLLAGAAVGGGLFLLALSLYGMRPRPPTPDKSARRKELIRALTTRGAIAAISGAGVLIITGWPVMAGGAVLLVLAWRGLSGGAAEERSAMRRLEGLAAWTESLRDTIAGAAGLEQAIPASIRAAAPMLRPHLRAMVDRLHTRMALPAALRLFADELDDPSADLVIAALILNARLRGPGLRDVLGALAVSAREELDMRRRVESERRATRRSVQIVVGTAVGFAVLLVVWNPSYVQEYDDALGQAVLVVVAGLFGAGFAWMRRLARFDKPSRLLGTAMADDGQAAAARPEQAGANGQAPKTAAAGAPRPGGGRGD